MKQSLSYYITLLVIKLKGIKKDFKNDPLDYKKIRKEDVYQPKASFFKQHKLRSFKILDSLITEISSDDDAKKLLIFVHGGAFVSGPAQHHWDAVKEIVKQTNHKVWMCDYPKAPENKIDCISENIDAVYEAALKDFSPSQITLVGDSVGGTLIASLVQRLIQKNMEPPKQIVLITPVMDASMSNSEIEAVDLIDPMLSKAGVLSAKKMCVGDYDLKDPVISPLYGSFEGFPKTILFLAENDIAYPDQKLTVKKLEDAHVEFQVFTGKNMPHIWPLLPVMKEAKESLNQMIKVINN